MIGDMPRRPRQAMGCLAYHVLNRAVGRSLLFEKDGDYEAFERVLAEAIERTGTRVCSYCIMPNHWLMVVWPQSDGELSEFMRWLTVTHTQRWHANRHTAGTGPVYQGRFKSFPIEHDGHFLRVCRYVERNALRAGLVDRAEAWRWCSLWRRHQTSNAEKKPFALPPSSWPVEPPHDWVAEVNQIERQEELDILRSCVRRGAPFGTPEWQTYTGARLGLESSLRARGRPRKDTAIRTTDK